MIHLLRMRPDVIIEDMFFFVWIPDVYIFFFMDKNSLILGMIF